MRKLLLLLFTCALFSPCAVQAQVAPSSIGGNTHLWAGAGYSNYDPDWGSTLVAGAHPRLPGISIYADLGMYKRFGIEGAARFFNFTQPDGLTEKSFLGGPYAAIYRHGHISVNAKFLVGVGLVTYTGDLGYGSYFNYAPGGDVEYRLARKWKARVEYEYQLMPSAPGLPTIPNVGVNPHGFTGGVSYRVF